MSRLRSLGFLLKDVSRLYTGLYEERASHMDVTLAQCKALVYISKNEGISQIRLAELTGIDPMTLVRMLDRMEADEWIERRTHPTDRRARQLYLRTKAQPTLEQIWKLGDEVRGEMLSGIKAEHRELLIDVLERAHDNLLKLTVKLDGAGAAKNHAKPMERRSVSKLPERVRRAAKPKSKAVSAKKLLRTAR